jgi:Ca-activated chloride channel family protein
MRSWMRVLGLVWVFGFLGVTPGVSDELPVGSGTLQALGPDGEAIGSCPLEHTDVTAEIAGFVSRVVVTQRFENPFEDPIEAIYTFPLSERAAVDAMRIRTGEREIRGEIRRREEARRIYEEAKSRGQLAALLDEERPNIFTQAIANLMPGEAVEIVIEYVEPLKYEAGPFEVTFPTVVGPRFIPGEARVPDASRITPPVPPEGTRSGHDIGISVNIHAGVPILDLDSRLHEIDVERPEDDRARVTLRSKREIPNRDFVLRYAVAGDEVRSGYLVHRDEGDGYVTFVLLPPKRVTAATAAPKELVFVIDRSGSQNGLPLTKAKETMLWILDHMNPNDTFQVVSFSSSTEMLFDRPQRASVETKRQARAYINALRANGGTMMAEAVQRITQIPADDNRLRIVTFMTDGYIGNDFEVIDLVRRLRGTSRWFPFGTGNSVNRFLLENMARYGGGETEYVLLNEPGEVVAKKFYERIASPVLTDVSLEFRGLDVIDVLPTAVGDVWADRPLVIQARYRKSGKGSVILRGFRQGQPYRQELEVELPGRERSSAAIASMWARAKVEELMAQDLRALQSGNFPTALKEEIVRVALAHQILSRFTSFVAVEDRVVNEGGELRTVTVPVEMPQGVTYEGVFGEADAAVAGAPSAAYKSHGRLARTLTQALAGPVAMLPAEEARRAEDVEKIPATPGKSLSSDARKRLDPELLALAEGRQAPAASRQVINGKIEVKVVLADRSDETLEDLRKAGLRISLTTDSYVVGEIEVEKLRELAELEVVERIGLP